MTQFSIYKKHPWIYDFKKRLLLSFLLTALVIFILVFLKPFDTGEKYLPNKNLMLAGYGICILLADLLLLTLERVVVLQFKKYWILFLEIVYLISLFVLSSIFVYSYDIAITKQNTITWDYLLTFSYQFILPIALLLLPALAYYRYATGKIIAPEQINNPSIQLKGENQNDWLEVKLHQLVCIKAEDNYVRIIYLDGGDQTKEIMMRSTLSNMERQVKQLRYCHRSYLIAPWCIKHLEGHKQKAKVMLHHYDHEIPVSTSYFNSINRLRQL